MAAANTDKFKKLTNNFSTTLTGAVVGAADTSMSIASTTNLPTDTGTVFVIDRVNSSGTATPTLREYVVGTVVGLNVTNLVRGVGNSTAQAHANGAVVEQVVDQRTLNDIVDGTLQDHAQLGYHKSLTDTNGNTWLSQTAVASAVNYWNNANAATSGKPTLQPQGADTNISASIKGKGTGLVDVDGAVPVKFFALYDFIESGCVWTADAAGSTRAATMTSGFVWIAGKRLTVAAVTSRTFAASKDAYVDFGDNGDGTATINYDETTANNGVSPALAASRVRNAILVVGATSIATAASINQGQEDRVLPIASSIPYTVTDSLGNLICPRDPQRGTLGYRQILVNFSTASTTQVQVTGLSCPVIVPTGRKINITAYCAKVEANGANTVGILGIWDGVVASGTNLEQAQQVITNAGFGDAMKPEIPTTPAAASKTYNLGFHVSANTGQLTNAAGSPAWIRVELV